MHVFILYIVDRDGHSNQAVKDCIDDLDELLNSPRRDDVICGRPRAEVEVLIESYWQGIARADGNVPTDGRFTTDQTPTFARQRLQYRYPPLPGDAAVILGDVRHRLAREINSLEEVFAYIQEAMRPLAETLVSQPLVVPARRPPSATITSASVTSPPAPVPSATVTQPAEDRLICHYQSCTLECSENHTFVEHLVLDHGEKHRPLLRCPETGCNSTFDAACRHSLRTHLTDEHDLGKKKAKTLSMEVKAQHKPYTRLRLPEPMDTSASSASLGTDPQFLRPDAPSVPPVTSSSSTSNRPAGRDRTPTSSNSGLSELQRLRRENVRLREENSQLREERDRATSRMRVSRTMVDSLTRELEMVNNLRNTDRQLLREHLQDGGSRHVPGNQEPRGRTRRQRRRRSSPSRKPRSASAAPKRRRD